MTRLDELEAKLKARQGRVGYKDNAKVLEAEIERMKRESL